MTPRRLEIEVLRFHYRGRYRRFNVNVKVGNAVSGQLYDHGDHAVGAVSSSDLELILAEVLLANPAFFDVRIGYDFIEIQVRMDECWVDGLEDEVIEKLTEHLVSDGKPKRRSRTFKPRKLE